MPPQSAILLITGGGYTELPCPTLSVIITVTKKIFKTLSLSLSALKLILQALDTRVEIFFIDLMTDSCSRYACGNRVLMISKILMSRNEENLIFRKF